MPDDPNFTTAVYANLFDDRGGETFSLIWSRGGKLNGDCPRRIASGGRFCACTFHPPPTR